MTSNYAITILIIVVVMYLLLNTNLGKHPTKYIGIGLAVLCVLAFFINPIDGYIKHGDYIDLYRFFYHMDTFKKYGWNTTLDYMQEYKTMPVVKIVLYLISLTNINQLLPAFGCLVGYGVFAKTIKEIRKTLDCAPILCSFAFFLFVTTNNFVNLISNLRFPVGLIIYFYILYKDIVNEEPFSRCLIGYIILCGIHSIFIAFLAFRLILLFTNKYSMWTICIISFIAGLFLNLWSSSLINIQSTNALINNVIYKISYYTREEISGHVDTLYVLMTYVRMLLLVISLLKVKKDIKYYKDGKFKQIFDYSILLIFVMIGSSWNFHLFTRISHLVLMIDIMWIMVIENMRLEKENNKTLGKLTGIRYMTKYEAIYIVFTLYHIMYFVFSHVYRMAWF